jgi:two-component system, NtrC family, response regulator AtoC
MLLVSKRPWAFDYLSILRRANGWQLDTSGFGLEALERIRSRGIPHVVLLDLESQDADGLHTLRWLHRVHPEVPVILLSSAGDHGQLAEAFHVGARDYVTKPCQTDQLEKALKRQLRQHQGNNSASTNQEIEPIGEELFFVSASPVMLELRGRLELLAQVDVPVMIVGEGGSGKEATARLLHKLSGRSGFAFLRVNSAVLTEELLKNALFGPEPGIVRGEASKSDLCRGGTLLLDKVEQMPAPLQSKLLQVLQSKRPSPSASGTARNVGVRILAATGMEIKEAVEEKKLRADLYYRLSAFTVHIAPLRRRTEEISLLLEHFMNRKAKQCGLSVRNFPPNLLEACQQYRWPGNLKELEDFAKCYLIMGEESSTVKAVMTNARPSRRMIPNSTEPDGMIDVPMVGLKSLVRSAKNETEKNAIASALEETRWNRKAASRLLRISYRALLYKIQQYHITPPEYLSDFTPS